MTDPSPSENVRASVPRPARVTAAPASRADGGSAPPLTSRHVHAMRVVLAEQRVTAHGAAAALSVSRPTAGAALRALERAGLLDGELVGGGELGYTATPAGRAWLAQASGGDRRRARDS
jgi:hypothetical protein